MGKTGKQLILDDYFLEKIIENQCGNSNISKDRLKHLEHWSCFSDPDMDEHVCNYSSLLKGKLCDYCRNNEELKFDCYRVCQISHLCLSAYANRLKGEFDKEYFERLLTISYDELLLEIETLEKGDLEEVKEEVKEKVSEVEEELFLDIVEEVPKKRKSRKVKEVPKNSKPKEVEGFVNVKKAAEIVGVSIPTMYNYVKKGRVDSTKDGFLRISVKSLSEII